VAVLTRRALQIVGTNALFNTGRAVRAPRLRMPCRLSSHAPFLPQPVALDCTVLFPLDDEFSIPTVLTTLGELAASLSHDTCDPLIREEEFKTNVMTKASATIGLELAQGVYLNNTADFLGGSLPGACAATACMVCFCREGMLEGAGGGYGAAVPDEDNMCAPYHAAFRAQDELRYITLGISIAAMAVLLTARPPSTHCHAMLCMY
jgi:hypothetical protein